jgi:hypothetical protein
VDGKQVFRANHRVDRPVRDAAMHEFGDKQVAHEKRAYTCLRVRAVLALTAPAWLVVSVSTATRAAFNARF